MYHLDPSTVGTFDVVYSFGVLHHTGVMYDTIMHELGFEPVRSFVYPCIGLLGAGCDEYSFTRKPASNSTEQRAS